MGATLDQIRTMLPGLARWLSLVFTVLGGFMGATGALTIVIALHLESLRTPTAAAALLTAGAAGVGVMSTVNFVLQSDFRWLLLVRPLLWIAGLTLLAVPSTRHTRAA